MDYQPQCAVAHRNAQVSGGLPRDILLDQATHRNLDRRGRGRRNFVAMSGRLPQPEGLSPRGGRSLAARGDPPNELEASVEEVLTNLEKRAVSIREQEAFHAQQEVHHREQRALCAAELEKVEQSLEAFRNIAPTAVDLARPLAAAATPAGAVEEALPPPGRLMVSRLLRMVVANPALQEPFGATAVAAEANRRFAARLRKPIGPRTASDVLRRMLTEGEIELAREGKAFHEALYRRRPRRR